MLPRHGRSLLAVATRSTPVARLKRAIDGDFVSKIAETFLTRVFLIGIGLITSVMVARVLQPGGRGVFATATALSGVGVQLGTLGLHASNTYYVSKDRRLLPALLGNSLLVSGLVGGGGAIIAWFGFAGVAHLAEVHGLLLGLALAWVPAGLANLFLQNLLLGIQEVRAFNRIELVTKILLVGLLTALILLNAVSVEAVFAAGLVPVVVSILWCWHSLRRQTLSAPKLSLPLFRDNLRYGVNAYLAALFSFLVIRVDLLMVRHYLGDAQTGYYSIAVAMADLIYMFPTVVGTILFPKLAAISDTHERWRITMKTLRGMGAVMLPMLGVGAVLAGPMVRIMYGNEFIPAVPAFLWLMPGVLLLGCGTILQNYLGATGRASTMVYGPLIATVINVLANSRLIPAYGVVGASLASSLAYACMVMISYHMCRRSHTLAVR